MRRKRKQKTNNTDKDFSIELVKELDKNIDNLKNMLEEPNDLVIREFSVRGTTNKCAVVYIGISPTL